MNPDGLSVVIPNWNGVMLLQRFLPSVERELARLALATGLATEIVIADDGSTDASLAWLAAHAPSVRVLPLAVNRGFAIAANAGVAAARFAWVALLNSDVELLPGAFTALPHWFDRADCFGVTFRASDIVLAEPDRPPVFSSGGKLGRFRRGFWSVWDNYDAAPAAPPAALPTFYLTGGFTAFRHHVFTDLGGFDPEMAPYYWEDVDLSYRARKAGWMTAYEPAIAVLHARSSSVARHKPQFQREVYIHRNRLQFHWKNLGPVYLAQHLLWCHLALLQMAFKGEFAYHAGYARAVARLPRILRQRRALRPGWRVPDAALAVAPSRRQSATVIK